MRDVVRSPALQNRLMLLAVRSGVSTQRFQTASLPSRNGRSLLSAAFDKTLNCPQKILIILIGMLRDRDVLDDSNVSAAGWEKHGPPPRI